MDITVVFGTESGNSELVADDVAASLEGVDVDVRDMAELDPAELDTNRLLLVICSTYGDGELPVSARPFAEAMDRVRPDLSGLRYAMFGLGDSSYLKTYSQGSEIIDRQLAELGATRIGDYGRHDAATFESASDLAVEWAGGVLESLAVPDRG